MSNDFTMLSDLHGGAQGGGAYPQPAGMPHVGGPPQLPLLQTGPPAGRNTNFDMLKQYLASSPSSNDSDDDDEDDDDDPPSTKYKKGSSGGHVDYWKHIFRILVLILLAVILYFIIKVKKELGSMYEE